MQSHSWLLSLLGLRNGLCVAATTLRQQSVFRCLDVVLLRTHMGSGSRHVSLRGHPSNEHHWVRIDFSHHCQPSWWSPECLAMCVARNVWRSSADPVPWRPIPVSGLPGSIELCARCQRMFRADWQERLSLCRWFNGSFSHATSPWPQMSVPPVSASILFRCPPSPVLRRFLRWSRRGFTSSIPNWSLICFNGHSPEDVSVEQEPKKQHLMI